MATTGKPRLLSDDVYRALNKRTGLPAGVCEKVIRAYCEIVKQGIINQVEIPLATLGTFSYDCIPPQRYNEWFGTMKDDDGNLQKVAFYLENADGKLVPKFRVMAGFKRAIMDNTKIPFSEDNCIDGYSSVKADLPRVNYREYYSKHSVEEDAKKRPIYEPDDYDLLVGRDELNG